MKYLIRCCLKIFKNYRLGIVNEVFTPVLSLKRTISVVKFTTPSMSWYVIKPFQKIIVSFIFFYKFPKLWLKLEYKHLIIYLLHLSAINLMTINYVEMWFCASNQ